MKSAITAPATGVGLMTSVQLRAEVFLAWSQKQTSAPAAHLRLTELDERLGQILESEANLLALRKKFEASLQLDYVSYFLNKKGGDTGKVSQDGIITKLFPHPPETDNAHFHATQEETMKDYDEIMRKKGLPDVGQNVRSKKYGTIWRVMEKRETWMNIDDDPSSKEPRMIPSIYLSYWKVREDAPPGVGKMMGHLYTLYDNTFEANWEKVKK